MNKKIKTIKKTSLYTRLQQIKKAGLNPSQGLTIKEKDPNLPQKLSQRIQEIRTQLKKVSQKNHSEMVYMIFYDISDNKVRKEISKYLIGKGCYRIQKSVFMGSMERKEFQAIADDLQEVQEMYENEDSIILLPVAHSESQKMKVIGQQIDLDLNLDNKNTLIF